MSIVTCCELLIGIIVIGIAIAIAYILLQGAHGLEHPAYVEYVNDSEEIASVHIYQTSRRYRGYRKYDFLHKNGKWKYSFEKKTITYILIAVVVLLALEIISLGISGYMESSVILPVLLLDLFFITMVSAIPIADIVRAYSALDDGLRKRKENEK